MVSMGKGDIGAAKLTTEVLDVVERIPNVVEGLTGVNITKVFPVCSFQLSRKTVFFNLFSEAEPFAAILIVHGTHVFLRGTPEGRNSRPKANSGGGVLEEGQRPHPHLLRVWGSAVSSPGGVWGRAPTANIF